MDAAAGLTPGYCVSLEIHKLQDSRERLAHQLARDGEVDPALKWLDDIIRAKDGPPKPSTPRAKHKSRPGFSAGAARQQRHEGEGGQEAPQLGGTLEGLLRDSEASLAQSTAGKWLPTYSEMYAGR